MLITGSKPMDIPHITLHTAILYGVTQVVAHWFQWPRTRAARSFTTVGHILWAAQVIPFCSVQWLGRDKRGHTHFSDSVMSLPALPPRGHFTGLLSNSVDLVLEHPIMPYIPSRVTSAPRWHIFAYPCPCNLTPVSNIVWQLYLNLE